MPRTRRSKKPVEDEEPEVDGVESESEPEAEVESDDEGQADGAEDAGEDGSEPEQDGESEPSTPTSRRRPLLSAGFYPSNMSPAERTPYRRNLFGAVERQPLKTPPHIRKHSFLKRGYQIYENPQQCLRTFNEVNNETSNVYACLFGIFLLVVLNVNIGWVVYGSNLGVDVRFIHLGILLAVVSLVGKLLYHLYIPLPEYFNFWSAVNLLSINLAIASVLLTLWGQGYPVDQFTKLDALPLISSLRESISVEWWLVFLALIGSAVTSFVLRFKSRSVLTPLWLKVLDTSVGLFFMVPFVMKARGSHVRGSLFLAFHLLAAIVHQFKIPERCSPRRFDIYGNSRNLYILLHVLALYMFFSDQFIAKTGLGDRLWDSYLFCE